MKYSVAAIILGNDMKFESESKAIKKPFDKFCKTFVLFSHFWSIMLNFPKLFTEKMGCTMKNTIW